MDRVGLVWTRQDTIEQGRIKMDRVGLEWTRQDSIGQGFEC